MKKLITYSFIGLAFLPTTNLLAQEKSEGTKRNQETIIIEDDKPGKSNTTIEIKNGQVFIDGKKVTDGIDDKDKNVKIIKKKIIVNGQELNDEDMEIQSFDFPFDFENQVVNKPMLGISSKPSVKNDGAEVESVVPNSPAAKLGLRQGDLITRINDVAILTPKDLVDAIGKYKPGDAIDITYERENKLTTKNVVLSEKKDAMVFRGNIPFNEENFMELFNGPNSQFKEFRYNPLLSENNSPKIGVSVEDRADGEGVLVNEVNPNSAAEKSGIQKHDVITIYNSAEIKNVDDLIGAIAASKNKESVNIEIMRNGVRKNLTLQVPKILKKKEL